MNSFDYVSYMKKIDLKYKDMDFVFIGGKHKWINKTEITIIIEEDLKKKKKKKNQSKKYKDLKQIVLERDGYRCAECGMISNLETHHIEHRSDGGKDDLDNLITLCVYCHYEQHKHQPIGNLMLGNMRSKGLIRSE